ncbi:winged helix-turn-helix transcriptional regulator [Marinomonas sp. TW1]|uniref:winged helix-turn-helix transcriptional regulator n=1 Tax=Marinomonas sp. TW1 TaxID=1561203 RepID=UPI0007AF397D|nr:helix-turn-helix domain-containing protein [Marinomonas sp. TW1]
MSGFKVQTEGGKVIEFTRGNVLSDQCPSREILKHVTSRWAVLIFMVLKDGERHRFSDLRRTIEGVSEKMLAQTLQTLEQDNFVQRTSYPVVPPKVEYNLTPTGLKVADHVIDLVSWLEDNIFDILPADNINPS